MNVREWFADNIGYRFFGCEYNTRTGPIFDFLQSKLPRSFVGKRISDLGCGDGTNTLRIQYIFKPKEITGYEQNDYLIDRARKKGLSVRKWDLNKELPHGEMAMFTLSLHHLYDKQRILLQAKKNFRYIVVCEPIRDFYHALFDAGSPLTARRWKALFDKTLKHYEFYQYKNTVISFYDSTKAS